jgi:hypothetical protein
MYNPQRRSNGAVNPSNNQPHGNHDQEVVNQTYPVPGQFNQNHPGQNHPPLPPPDGMANPHNNDIFFVGPGGHLNNPRGGTRNVSTTPHDVKKYPLVTSFWGQRKISCACLTIHMRA